MTEPGARESTGYILGIELSRKNGKRYAQESSDTETPHFAATGYTSAGVQSGYSNGVTFTVPVS